VAKPLGLGDFHGHLYGPWLAAPWPLALPNRRYTWGHRPSLPMALEPVWTKVVFANFAGADALGVNLGLATQHPLDQLLLAHLQAKNKDGL
jgi:hypothetical protein